MFTRQRVVKGYSVKMTGPLVLEPSAETFQHLFNKIPTVSKIRQNNEIFNQVSPAEISSDLEDKEREIEQKYIEAEQVLLEAEKKAQAFLEAAQIEALEIKNLAHEEIEQWKEEVAKDVRAEILPQAKLEADTIIEEAKKLFNLAENTYQNELSKTDEKLMVLAISIAERIIKSALAIKPQNLLNIINALVLMPQEKDEICLQLSSHDAAWITALGYEAHIPCRWVINEALRQGDVYLEHKHGLYDARLETQLKKLEQILREELTRG